MHCMAITSTVLQKELNVQGHSIWTAPQGKLVQDMSAACPLHAQEIVKLMQYNVPCAISENWMCTGKLMWDFPGSENLSEMRYVYVLYISFTKTAPGNLSFLPVLILVYRVQYIYWPGGTSPSNIPEILLYSMAMYYTFRTAPKWISMYCLVKWIYNDI